MRTHKTSPKGFDFYFPNLDNMVLVEAGEDETVVIRAVRDNFSDQQKAFFIRQLANEGFIPERYQFFSGSIGDFTGIRWIIDYSWLKIPEDVIRRSNRFMGRIFAAAALVWLLAMLTVLTGKPTPSGKPAATRGSSNVPRQSPIASVAR